MPMHPPALSPDLLSRLALIVGEGHFFADDETRTTCGRDETEDLFFPPDVVVKPANTGEVSAILRLATATGTPVTPRGGGTGLSGGALPAAGGICLSMERFNRMLEIDAENLQAVVEPGVVTQKFQDEVEALGLYYPPDPASRGSCHLGGNLAECAGGPHAVKYGVTKDYVLGCEAVLANGSVLSTGGRVLKNVTGYNLTQLIVGSEGTLAVITKIILRLIPRPAHRKLLLASFTTLDDATRAVAAVFRAGVTPSAMEFLESSAVAVAEERLGKKFPNSGAAAQLFVEVDGNHEPALAKDVATIAGVLERFNVADVLLAEEERRIKEVWDLRSGVGEAVKSLSVYREEDTVVPRSQLPRLVEGVKEIALRHGLTTICYGHAGDGNVHVNILKDRLDDAAWQRVIDPAIREIFALTVKLGGTISGEHGIGYSQRPYLPLALSPSAIELMKQLKHLFDPAGILNPGKIFP